MFKKITFQNYHNICSWTALILLIAAELMSFGLIQGFWSFGRSWPLGGVILLTLLMAIGKWIKDRSIFKSVILTKLLANAISPRPLGTAYLLLFAIHIGWLTNVTMSLFLPNKDLCGLIINVGVCLFGLFVLTVFFPFAQEKKEEGCIKVFVTGISTIMGKVPNTYAAINIRPLVRILQLAANDEKSELLILQTEDFKKDEENQSNKIYDTLSQLVWEEGYGLCKEEFMKMELDDRIRQYIRDVAKKEFPEKMSALDNLNIQFSTPCDYNDFKSCFNALNDLIIDKDDARHKLIFNLTPGTKLVSSLITLHAIHGGRDLYFYSQDSKIEDDKHLQPVDKNRIPLHNILSQALETMDAQD